ncbi:hypothetical protein Dxin01_01059 [Deinococcus xinjiangensis]|uniref:Uncharacterized protein n=1 Tax=Deinococcus xinjiangensis TaxID=457454 RepID=A0ABP9V7T2_9DEIO
MHFITFGSLACQKRLALSRQHSAKTAEKPRKLALLLHVSADD